MLIASNRVSFLAHSIEHSALLHLRGERKLWNSLETLLQGQMVYCAERKLLFLIVQGTLTFRGVLAHSRLLYIKEQT